MATMTINEVAKAISGHFGGNSFLTNQGVLSFLEEYGDEYGDEDTSGQYPAEIVEEWLAR